MSAFICMDDCFDLLTTGAAAMMAAAGAPPRDAALQAIFDDLRQTNYDSVNYRYSENESPEPRRFRMVNEAAPMQPEHLVQIRSSIDTYTYQSCEHSGWATSEAYKLMVNLGEWVDGKLDAAGWVKLQSGHGSSFHEEWLGDGLTSGDWTRERGFPDFTEFTPAKIAAIRKMQDTFNQTRRRLS